MAVWKSLDVASDIKYINVICKFMGLAPYKIMKGSFSEGIEVDYSVRNNIIVIVWSAILALLMLIWCFPITYNYAHVNISFVDNLNTFVAVPMISVVACIAILINLTINKRKISKFFIKISHIDNKLSCLYIKDSYTNCMKFQENADILIFLFVLIPYIVFDIWLWIPEDGSYILIITLRYGHMVDVALMMHFCACVKVIRKRLTMVCKFTEEMRIPSLTAPQLRSLLGDICEAARILNSIYGLLILLELTRIFLIVIVNLHSIMNLLSKSPLVALSLIIWKIMALTELIYIIVTCEMTVTKLKKLTFSIHNILFQKFHITVDVFQQFALFLHQISTCGLEFTACGLFKLDYAFLCSVVTSFISYAVILYQF
ncbi:hypothetical protein L9F63_001341, partial [Diploptera punctata]